MKTSAPVPCRITITVSPAMVKLVRSPVYFVVAALTGVSVTFAPLFLYWSGQGKFLGSEWIVVPLCFAIICLIPAFYFRLGSPVLKALRQQSE